MRPSKVTSWMRLIFDPVVLTWTLAFARVTIPTLTSLCLENMSTRYTDVKHIKYKKKNPISNSAEADSLRDFFGCHHTGVMTGNHVSRWSSSCDAAHYSHQRPPTPDQRVPSRQARAHGCLESASVIDQWRRYHEARCRTCHQMHKWC